VDSRPADDFTIRRRRECEGCGRRVTTYERVEKAPLYVVKRDGSLQMFDPARVKASILRACEKRTITMAQVDNMVSLIEKHIHNGSPEQITSQEIGNMVMSVLRDVDEVAYVRYASVYWNIRDIKTFRRELEKMMKKT